jgi:hypothetical protein
MPLVLNNCVFGVSARCRELNTGDRPPEGIVMTATEAAASPRSDAATSTPLISKGWVQVVALVMIFGFLVMGILVYRTYTASMPMPNKVVSESGKVLFSDTDITDGQELYQARGLMEYGSVLGHGAYLGPDYTAEYLRMATDDVAAQWRGLGMADPRDAEVAEFRTNRYNPDNARGELQASEELREAAETLSKNPASLQLRYLQTLLELGADHNSTVVFPLPVDIITPFLRHPEMLESIAGALNERR